MFGLTYVKLGAIAVVAITMGFFLAMWRIDAAQLSAAHIEYAACQTANKDFETKVANQNAQIGDLLQSQANLQDQVAADQNTINENTKQHVSDLQKQPVPKDCEEASQWGFSKAPELSAWH